jgi:hypothetical protein
MVKKLRCQAEMDPLAWVRVADRTAIVVLLLVCSVGIVSAGQKGVHYLHQGVMPPGAIGSTQLQRGGPLPGFFQPVEIKAPNGTAISLAVGNHFEPPLAAPQRLGLLIGQVYRIRVTQIPLAEGVEVFPTIEVIDRLYAPRGQEQRFAIPIEIAHEDLMLAAQGKFVTRIIYVEDPTRALPVAKPENRENCIDAQPGRDPLAMADELGRPVAILRLGGRLPVANGRTDASFFFGSPPLLRFAARVKRAMPTPASAAKRQPRQPMKTAIRPRKANLSSKVRRLPPPPRGKKSATSSPPEFLSL